MSHKHHKWVCFIGQVAVAPGKKSIPVQALADAFSLSRALLFNIRFEQSRDDGVTSAEALLCHQPLEVFSAIQQVGLLTTSEGLGPSSDLCNNFTTGYISLYTADWHASCSRAQWNAEASKKTSIQVRALADACNGCELLFFVGQRVCAEHNFMRSPTLLITFQ